MPFLGHVDKPGGESLWMKLGLAVAAIAGVIVIGRYLTRPALRLIAKTDVRELFTAFALLLVIGIAELMQLAGLSMALGAFLAGVLLAGSEFRHALEGDIEPFKGLLLGLFFISVGMSIDFGLLGQQTRHGARYCWLGFLALKIALALGGGAARSRSAARRWLFAFLLSQGGEFAFVVFAERARGARASPARARRCSRSWWRCRWRPRRCFLALHDRSVSRKSREEREADTPEPVGPVIIAGFGRFGQIVGRLLLASDVRAVVLDHDPDQIESLRKFGFKVFYGDATRLDLLRGRGRAAGHACW